MIRHPHLSIFVATTAQGVPCHRFISVDGSVPGAAVTWDHHVTGEAINLDAMPERFDASGFDGVGTTMIDTDAVASVVAVLAGGKGRLDPHVLRVLEAASHRCDHLSPHPDATDSEDELGRGLDAWVVEQMRDGASFASICREVAEAPMLPWRDPDDEEDEDRVEALVRAGRLRSRGPVAVTDLRGVAGVPVDLLYEEHDCPVMVLVDDHPRGGVRYTVGVNPRVNHPADLGPALRALAAAEHGHGAPCQGPDPVPGAENWGGRATVFGSPWNYGSRLAPDQVTSIVARALGLR